MVSFLFMFTLVTILYCSDIVWSKDLSAYFFYFLSILDQEFSFSCVFASSHSLIGNFLFLLSSDSLIGNFVFFQAQGWTFSPWVKVYGKLGFWLKVCRTAGHDVCQGVGLASGSGIKEMSHIISMIHTTQ